MIQSISGENQPELVREAANLHSGKMSKGSNPGQAGAQERLEREPCWNLDLLAAALHALDPWVHRKLPRAEGGTTVASGGIHS